MTLTYADNRFKWQTKDGPIVHVHWYDGGGVRRAGAGDRRAGDPRTSALLGVTETKPVDFYIYADQQPFYDALGPGTRENVGGEAVAQIRTLFALITPDEIDDSWVGHGHPARADPPRLQHRDRQPVPRPAALAQRGPGRLPQPRATCRATASRSTTRSMPGGIIPLDGLVGQFPTTADQFDLAYGESVSGGRLHDPDVRQPALVKLIRSYAGRRHATTRRSRPPWASTRPASPRTG